MFEPLDVDKTQISDFPFTSFSVTSFMAITTTVVAGYQYGASITSNVLEILPKSNVLYFAIMLVTLQLCLSSAVGTSPLFQHIEERLKIPKSENRFSVMVLKIFVTGLPIFRFKNSVFVDVWFGHFYLVLLCYWANWCQNLI